MFSELLPHHVGAEEVRRRNPKGLILSGGPASVYADGAPRLDPELLELGIPVLGICYGMQLVTLALGGRVEGAEIGEFGRSDLTVREPGRLLEGLPAEQTCWMSHRDTVYSPPEGFTALASSTQSPVAALESVERGIYGIQFHPEVVHTPYGQDILKRFLGDVCGADLTWSAANIVEEQIERIRAQVGDGRVICGLSGGVDSSVAALLVHRAIGDQLTCVFVDHGLMRKNEGEQVVATFRDHFQVPLVAVDAEDRFLAKLAGVTDPETKRKAIGAEFIRVFEEEASKLAGDGEDAKFLVQGTLYSDVIESGGGTGAATIKSHHNVGGLPEDLQFDLVEPLRTLFKDEVRAVGAELGLPERLVWRQPFPGPGLAIRIVGGEATKERLDLLRDADYVLQDEIRKAGLYRDLWQSFCVLPDIRTVGVQGDERTYGSVVVIRAVTSDDAMTADWARLPVRPARADRLTDDQRAARGEPGGPRHHVEAPGNHRVGVDRRRDRDRQPAEAIRPARRAGACAVARPPTPRTSPPARDLDVVPLSLLRTDRRGRQLRDPGAPRARDPARARPQRRDPRGVPGAARTRYCGRGLRHWQYPNQFGPYLAFLSGQQVSSVPRDRRAPRRHVPDHDRVPVAVHAAAQGGRHRRRRLAVPAPPAAQAARRAVRRAPTASCREFRTFVEREGPFDLVLVDGAHYEHTLPARPRLRQAAREHRRPPRHRQRRLPGRRRGRGAASARREAERVGLPRVHRPVRRRAGAPVGLVSGDRRGGAQAARLSGASLGGGAPLLPGALARQPHSVRGATYVHAHMAAQPTALRAPRGAPAPRMRSVDAPRSRRRRPPTTRPRAASSRASCGGRWGSPSPRWSPSPPSTSSAALWKWGEIQDAGLVPTDVISLVPHAQILGQAGSQLVVLAVLALPLPLAFAWLLHRVLPERGRPWGLPSPLARLVDDHRRLRRDLDELRDDADPIAEPGLDKRVRRAHRARGQPAGRRTSARPWARAS